MKIKLHARNIDTRLRLAVYAMTEFALSRLIPSKRLRNNLSINVHLKHHSEGGEFQIKTGRENYIPPQQATGNLLLFPSYLVHRVTLVTEGTRFAIVGWVHGNSFQ